MFLSTDELIELTGRKYRTAQIRWLQENGFPFVLDADGRPRVLTAAVLAKLGAPVAESRPRLHLPKAS